MVWLLLFVWVVFCLFSQSLFHRFQIINNEDDANWFKAELDGKTGFIPANYVKMSDHQYVAAQRSLLFSEFSICFLPFFLPSFPFLSFFFFFFWRLQVVPRQDCTDGGRAGAAELQPRGRVSLPRERELAGRLFAVRPVSAARFFFFFFF